ncbi:hypothetical protein Scep_021642 [Stephania cephalantha]|uniref:5-formyltetrahydrofolate cyclo-ligase n=1 Tax=Stephania cephalantha TaxID=152367 RepID=A0AAP0FBQ1_9MAGN
MSRNGVGALLMSPPAAIAAAQTLFFSPLYLFSTTTSNHFQRSIAKMSTDPDPILLQKRALRSKVRKDLKAMDPSLRSQQDSAIQDLVLKSSWFRSSERLCAYISCSALREVDTSKILSEILCNPDKEGHSQMMKMLYVPRVEDKNSHMRMLNITSTDDLIANSMNILEPSPVDRDGNQRENGWGRDKVYLTTSHLERDNSSPFQCLAVPVALSYGLQIMNEGVIPMTPGDVPVDALVTPTGVIPISPSAMERLRGQH